MNAVDLAIHQTAHECAIGLPRLAELMGEKYQVLANKVNPHCRTHHLSVDGLRKMMLITADTQALLALNEEFGLRCQPTGAKALAGLLQAVLDADAEHGDVGRAISDALADRLISERERAQILNEIRGAEAVLASLRETLIANNGGRL